MIIKRKTPGTKRKISLRPTQIIPMAFLGIILLGTALLALPVASRNGISCGFRPALFTSTSATCVTGLVLFDTWTQFSGFGQIVIISLIEVGGLGFMSAAALVVFLLRRKVGLKQRLVIAQALSLEDMESVVKIQKLVIIGSFSIQLVGATILMIRFLTLDYSFGVAVKWGLFHAVSAFCNAGFDVLGSICPGGSLMPFNNDPVICITLMALIIVGGLGFFVWEEIVRVRRFRKFSVYSKLVLLTTAALILLGAGIFLALEWNNPGTLGPMPIGQKILNSLFQSVTLRTAGFSSINQAALTEAGKVIGVVLMLIGGSAGSTAGGMKTVTFLLIILFVWNRARGRSTVNVFHRQIPTQKIMDAMTIVSLMTGLVILGALFLNITSSVGFLDALFEAASSLATVGISTANTGSLSVASQYMIILFMYFGRVGVLTISLGFLLGDKAEERFSYAKTNLIIG